MTGYLIDASVAFEYLLRTPLGRTLANTIERACLVAPELMDAEVLSVLRKMVLRGRLEEERARIVVEDLIRWPVTRVRHRELARWAWYHHRNVTAYDALYVACASLYRIPLLTADSRLTRASGLGVVMQDVQNGLMPSCTRGSRHRLCPPDRCDMVQSFYILDNVNQG